MEAKELYDLFDRHFQVWTEGDKQRRELIISNTYSTDIEMIDPYFAFRGWENIGGFVEGLQSRFPGCVFSLTRPLEYHHDVVRAFWQFAKPGELPATTGQDIAFVREGKIQKLLVFLDGVNIIKK